MIFYFLIMNTLTQSAFLYILTSAQESSWVSFAVSKYTEKQNPNSKTENPKWIGTTFESGGNRWCFKNAI